MKKIISIIRDFYLNLYSSKLKKLTYIFKKDFLEYHIREGIPQDVISKYGVNRVQMRHVNGKLLCVIHLEHPGILIGKKGANIEAIKKAVGYDVILKKFNIWKT